MSRPAPVRTWALVLLLASPSPLASQAPTPIDTLRPEYRVALLALRDTVTAVRAELQLFSRDLAQAGPETVLSRAAGLVARCRGAVAALRAAEPVFQPGRVRETGIRRAAGAFAEQLRTLETALEEHCDTGLRPIGEGARADTLKAWGPHRAGRIERALLAYTRAANTFARAAGIRLAPRIR